MIIYQADIAPTLAHCVHGPGLQETPFAAAFENTAHEKSPATCVAGLWDLKASVQVMAGA